MKSYRVSLVLMMAVAALAFTAHSVAGAVADAAGPRFLPIVCLAVVCAILLLALTRIPGRRSHENLPAVILAGAIILFLLVSHPPAHLQLPVAGLFILGLSLRLESRRSFWVGMILVAMSTLAVSAMVWLRAGGRFLPMDTWVYLLACLSGFCAVAGWRR